MSHLLIQSLFQGRPQFEDPAQTRLARADQAAAWQLALKGHDPKAVLAGTGGAFAVAAQSSSDASAPVVLGVDRFARETLCYRQLDGEVQVAARADELAGPTPEIDSQALFDYLFFHAIPSPRTIFRGVRRLPAANCVIAHGDSLEERRYWMPRFTAPPGGVDFAVLKARFLELLQTAVADELDDGTPACFLSGGTDSSTVAGMIARAAGKVSTFSIGFQADGYDEMAFARITAKRFGADHHEHYVTPQELIRDVPEMAASFDQPFGISSVVPAYRCALMAKECGVSRLLAGDGGDELFGGNSRYAKQRVFDAYGQLPDAVRTKVLQPLFGGRDASPIPFIRKAASYIDQARRPMPERTHLYNLLLRIGVQEVLEPGFLAAVDTSQPRQAQRAEWESAQADHDLDRTLAYDWRFTLAESDLPKVRYATTHAGVAVGYPMLDERIVDFSCQLPAQWKLKGMKLRWFFKEALRGFLPDEVITKKKQGFGLPFGIWLMQHQGLHAMADESLRSLAGRRIVRPAFIADLMDRHLRTHPGYYGEMVWILLMLEQWLRAHVPDFKHAD